MVTGQVEGSMMQDTIVRRGVIPAGTRQVRIMSHPGDRSETDCDVTVTVRDDIRPVAGFDGSVCAVDGDGVLLWGGDADTMLSDVVVEPREPGVVSTVVWCDGGLSSFDDVHGPLVCLGPDGRLYRRTGMRVDDRVFMWRVMVPEDAQVPVRVHLVSMGYAHVPYLVSADRVRRVPGEMQVFLVSVLAQVAGSLLEGVTDGLQVWDADVFAAMSDPVRAVSQ